MRKYALFVALLFLLFSCNEKSVATPREIRKCATINTGNAKIYYEEQGSGDTTLLFVHGWCIDGSYWEKQLRHFGKHYRVIAIDLPGFGKSVSERTDWTIEARAKDVLAAIHRLNLKNVVLIGHSMSGDIILEAALTGDPAIAGIVGIDNFTAVAAVNTPEDKKQMEEFMAAVAADYKEQMPLLAARQLFIPASDTLIVQRVQRDIRNTPQEIALTSMWSGYHYSQKEAANLQKLPYKLFLLNCADLSKTDEEGLRKYCRSSFEVIYLKGSGHYPMIEQPETFNRLLEGILKKMKDQR